MLPLLIGSSTHAAAPQSDEADQVRGPLRSLGASNLASPLTAEGGFGAAEQEEEEEFSKAITCGAGEREAREPLNQPRGRPEEGSGSLRLPAHTCRPRNGAILAACPAPVPPRNQSVPSPDPLSGGCDESRLREKFLRETELDNRRRGEGGGGEQHEACWPHNPVPREAP